nr:hypothetical protein [Tanacetum cinerariifolium]
MSISNELITDDIRGGLYYNEYLEKVAKHQRYIAGEKGSDPNPPVPKPIMATKPKEPKQSMPLVSKAEPVTKPTTAKMKGVLENEPGFDNDEANLQRAVEESLKDVHATHRGTLPPVVFREPDSGRRQPLPEKKSTTDQYILQRRKPKTTDPTGPSIHHEDEKATHADVETDTEELLTYTEKSGEEVSNTVVLEILTGSSLDPMDKGFTATAYPNVQENLKLTVEEHEILKEPASSTRTLSSLQHIAKDFSFGDQFFNDKPSEAENEKTTAETEVESMVSVTIQQDTSAIPPMTTLVIDLTSRPDSPNVHRPLQATATETTTTTTHPPPPQPQQSTTDYILIKQIDKLKQIMKKLIQDNKHLEESSKKSMTRDQTDQFLTDLAEARRKKKRRHDTPKISPGSPPYQPLPPPPPAGPSETSRSSGESGSSQLLPPPPLPPSINQEGQSHGSTAPSSSKTTASAEYTAWTTFNIRFKPYVSSILKDLHMDDDSAPDKHVHSSDDEDIRNDHIPMVNLMQNWWKPLSEEDRPATPELTWSIPSSDLHYQMEECQKLLTNKVDDALIRYNVSKPLPLGGQPGQVAIQTDFFFNKDLEYLRYGSKGGRPTLSISKIKVAYYLDVGLEQMHLPPKDKKILTTVVNLWTRILVIRQRVKDFQLGIKSHQTQLNLTKPRWDATGFYYKHDFTVIESLRAVIFRDKYGVQMITWFNEIHKFSDDTLHYIDEALDYRVNEFKVNRMNSGLNTRFWTRKDVDRSKEFMFAIQKRVKTKRIFCNLESFVGGRVREGDYRHL